MRNISAQAVEQEIYRLFREACVAPGAEIDKALEDALAAERTPHAREILEQLLRNNRKARSEGIPACQDTGIAVVFLEIGQDVHIEGSLHEAVQEGVRRAYEDGFCRASVLDPLSRQNTGNNLPAVIHTEIVPGDQVRIRVLPKGFGSENMSRLGMLKPAQGREGVEDFVVESARLAGGSPCPPVVLGVGIGGTFDSCALLAKKALLRPLTEPNPDKELREMEEEIRDRTNALGMGPMGMGGDSYCLKVQIEKEPTHIAGLPVAVNFCCHMLRTSEALL
ncbi:MAG: fumarate hydratase [Clostridia bacterium]|nr:fumarate hydratase [Clostridia bacterium]